MLRRLDTPRVPTADQIVAQFIGNIIIEVVLADDGLNTGGAIDLQKTAITVELDEITGDARKAAAKLHVLMHNQWTPELLGAVRTVRSEIQKHLEAQGVLDPGTDEQIPSSR